MTWMPVSHRILIKPDPVKEKSKGGIIIATNERLEMNAQQKGVILSIGEDAWSAFNTKRPFAGLQVGDRVAYAKYSGKWLDDGVLAINDEDIVAKEIPDDGHLDSEET